ncbi:hypothetical protein FHS42_005838 [Streptomyces zagrosensis]|uniref:Uncharacterized protein n=1 Tax=Streptomyces zagrosensis TaxID=1042984 RepID=A0A7W9V1A4_9ACTN|nr:hypothetical protein [Streptomyces zagrosensis]
MGPFVEHRALEAFERAVGLRPVGLGVLVGGRKTRKVDDPVTARKVCAR